MAVAPPPGDPRVEPIGSSLERVSSVERDARRASRDFYRSEYVPVQQVPCVSRLPPVSFYRYRYFSRILEYSTGMCVSRLPPVSFYRYEYFRCRSELRWLGLGSGHVARLCICARLWVGLAVRGACEVCPCDPCVRVSRVSRVSHGSLSRSRLVGSLLTKR